MPRLYRDIEYFKSNYEPLNSILSKFIKKLVLDYKKEDDHSVNVKFKK